MRVADLPISKRQRARLDQHTTHQSKYRKRLAEKKAPNREDFGRAALTVALLLSEKNKPAGLAEAMRIAISENLELAGFDREQVLIRFSQMVDRVRGDRDRWRRKRDWAEEKREKDDRPDQSK